MNDSENTLAPAAQETPADVAAAPANNGNQASRGGRGGRGGKKNPSQAGQPPAGQRQQRTVHPALEQLAALYPRLFGAEFLPLKRGIFQDIREAHAETFPADALKEALGQHTRSTRYLQGVANARPRHDLSGQPVEELAVEHVYQALIELWRRRANRTPEAGQEALRDEARQRLVRAFEASGLSREAYAEKVRTRDEVAGALLDEALAESSARAARDEALLRAFEAGNTTVEAFADMYGLDPRQAPRLLDAARRRREVSAAPAAAVPVEAPQADAVQVETAPADTTPQPGSAAG